MSYPPLIGLAGPSRSGKNTVADHLCDNYGYTRMAFSDALYEEVSDAFEVGESWLRDDKTKDTPHEVMRLEHCRERDFVTVATKAIDDLYRKTVGSALLLPVYLDLSPRQVLQWWGTEYRRAQDPDYWVKRLSDRYARYLAVTTIKWAGQVTAPLVVVDGVRYPNEVAWLRGHPGAEMWHLRRGFKIPASNHTSETPVKFEPQDRILFNDGSIADLHRSVDDIMENTQ